MIGRELIVDIPIDPRGYADMYIDDTTGLTIDLPGTHNANKLKAAIPLAIEVAARPNKVNKPIPWEPMVAQNKLKAEGGLAETKVILGWHFNFLDAYRDPPQTQTHCVVRGNSDDD